MRNLSSEQSLYNNSNYRIALELTTTHTLKSKSEGKSSFLDLVRGMDPAALWIFLATHGMWIKKPKEPSSLRVLVDSITGSRRLVINYQDYELISAILSIPIFEMFVEEISSVKGGELTPTPWGIHGKIKRGELLCEDADLKLKVTPLTFYAATIGYHRLGYSHRLAALQCAFSQKIERALFREESHLQTYSKLYEVKEEEEALGALIGYLSFIIRYFTEIDIKAVEAEMTTSIIRRPSEPRSLVKNVRSILQYVVKAYPDLNMEVTKKNNSLFIEFSDLKINGLLQQIQDQLNPFGRLSYLDFLMKEFEEKFRKECIDVVLLDFSEQMNPCDIYFLSLLIKSKLERDLSSTWIICTPLTYPVATVASAYAKNLHNLGEVNLVLSSEDPYIAWLLASKLSGKLKNTKVLYLAAGPTPHVFVFAKTLKEELNNNVLLEALTP